MPSLPSPAPPLLLPCSKSQSQFQGLRLGNAYFSVLIDAFTSNTYLLVVTSALPKAQSPLNDEGAVSSTGAGPPFLPADGGAATTAAVALPPDEAVLLNVALARPQFERLIAEI